MNRILFSWLLMPIVLVAAPPQLSFSPVMASETWVKEALSLAKARGTEALVAEVQNPKGRFRTSKPEIDPELTVYSSKFVILAVNRRSSHVGMDHSRMPDALGAPILKRMLAFAQDSGPGWLEYLGTDTSGHPKAFKAYVALQETNLIAAVIPK